MSSENRYLALRLQGPLQSWGFDSQYNRRNTGLMPTKSAIAGMCCAALGFDRGSAEERTFLADFAEVRMTSITAIPRLLEHKAASPARKRTLSVRRLQDYHTIQNTMKADGTPKPCHITHRQYLTDASFGVLIEGRAVLLKQIADALADPIWGIWLGRKTCIPSAPVLAGLRDSRVEALKLLIGEEPLESFTRQEDAESFAEGRDSLPDQALSFASDRRVFAPRRIRISQGKT
jgi:CRISPR system Cascade subunit CasD